MSKDTWVALASASDCPEGEITGFDVQGRAVAVYHLPGGEFHASSNICTHGQALLSEGWLVDDCMVECPLHAGCFDVRTGKGIGAPIETDLEMFELRQEGETIMIKLVS